MRHQSRVIIEGIQPELEGGRHAIKAVVDQFIPVTADVLCDGHDVIAACLLYKHRSERKWNEVRMEHLENDRWGAGFTVQKQGEYHYKIQGWVDYALNWQHGTERKIAEANQDRRRLQRSPPARQE